MAKDNENIKNSLISKQMSFDNEHSSMGDLKVQNLMPIKNNSSVNLESKTLDKTNSSNISKTVIQSISTRIENVIVNRS